MADKEKEKGTIWGNVMKCYGCKLEFLPAVPPDRVLSTFLLERSPIGTGINKAWNGAWGENRISIITIYVPNWSGHSRSYIEFQAFIVHSYLLTLCAPKQENRRKARQHVKILSRFNEGIPSSLHMPCLMPFDAKLRHVYISFTWVIRWTLKEF